MRSEYPRYVLYTFVLLIISWLVSCSGRSDKKTETRNNESTGLVEKTPVKLIKSMLPEENTGFRIGDQVNVELEMRSNNKLPDSVLVYFDSKAVGVIYSGPWKYTIPHDYTVSTGRKSIKVIAYREGKPQSTVTRFMIIYSDIIPKRNGYRVKNSYPHDKQAFTEGLFYNNGLLYESTGTETASSIREVELKTGKIIRQLSLESTLFGEGIALYKDRLYQVTYRNKVGFIYDKSTFNVINKIYYATKGWGMTTLDDKIIMSDGTNVLYFYEPEMFTVVSRIEVYDNEKKVDQLNELEYINGEIWANIWMTDLIARIDPVTGKVLAYIDLQGLLPKSERLPNTDVLNGIAYDKDSGRIFVTGKMWPKLYEISLTE